MIGRARLDLDVRSQETQQKPARESNRCSKGESSKSCEDYSRTEQEASCRKTNHEESMRGGMLRGGEVQAECDAAGKNCGDRYGRYFHGARLNRTSVSM
jgi:hypothetical protein